MTKKTTPIKPTKASKWFNKFIDENKTEILIHKAVMQIASQIKAQREKRGLSQRDIAKSTGLTQTTILRLEKGKNSNLETLIKVAWAMGLEARIEFEEV